MSEISDFISAVRLFNNSDGTSAFKTGKLPILKPMNTSTFWISNKTEDWEKTEHPAPRRQYVVTLDGIIRFKVSDGSTFLIKPGIILLAEDIEGKGHSWEIIEGEKWVRLYIPITDDAESFFIPDSVEVI
ncbi:hypothetical protein QFZ37_000369 [Chryseobacterium ginsenosidimutans]|uniref:hypothetical protein n=1 Tax=Chryseobacterium ginsenosidimutans TaxID=687846 RepID=UPI0027877CEE|nr:hypothetical protein [Chryseobacterium ginsenosidimutans]MDQ0592000.1 hypothetical protein [Chryseobacterium ginsenosidimutans]